MSGKSLRLVNAAMASLAECNEILLVIIACMASKFEVMHLECLHASAKLTAPSVALEHLSVEFAVCSRIELDAGVHAHDALPATSSTKACFCRAGKNR